MARFFFIACVLIASVLSKPLHANETLIFHAVNYPPYEIKNATNGLPGFDVEVIQTIFNKLNIPIKIEYIPWKRAVRNTLSGVSTGAFSCASRPIFHLSDPISTATNALFVKKDFNFAKYPIKTIEDLAKYPNLKVGGVLGYKQLNLLDKANIKYETSNDDDASFQKLFAGRIDVFLTIKEFAEYRLSSLDLTRFARIIPLNQKNFHVCFSKSWTGVIDLKNRFNEELAKLRKDGTYDAIHAKYK